MIYIFTKKNDDDTMFYPTTLIKTPTNNARIDIFVLWLQELYLMHIPLTTDVSCVHIWMPSWSGFYQAITLMWSNTVLQSCTLWLPTSMPSSTSIMSSWWARLWSVIGNQSALCLMKLKREKYVHEQQCLHLCFKNPLSKVMLIVTHQQLFFNQLNNHSTVINKL